MKKAILLSTLTTILTLSLAGCGSTGGLEDSVGVQNSTAPTGPIAPVIAESLVPTECPENGPADDLAISVIWDRCSSHCPFRRPGTMRSAI
jgi:hypothetical protein